MKKNTLLHFFLLLTFSNFSQNISVEKIEINYNGGSYPLVFAKTNDAFYFTAENNTYGRELWKSDGTENGTELLIDINSNPNINNGESLVNNLTVVNNLLYFTATDGINGLELWKSDGTENGTVMVKNINESSENDYNTAPKNLFAFQDKLYFSAYTNVNGWELWVSDGTANGTILLKDINEGTNSSEPYNFVSFNNNLYFIASNNLYGREIWKTDGTENGTILLKDISSGPNNGVSGDLISSNNNLYFTATSDNDNTIIDYQGYELWKTDGTESGTRIVKDIAFGSQSSMTHLSGIALNESLIFTAYTQDFGYEVWKTDGTESGTVLLKNINNTNLNSILSENQYVKFNNEIYFLADDNVNGTEIWKTNGTSAGTKILKNINTSVNYSSVSVNKFHVDEINNKLFFYGRNTNGATPKLWVSDGTEIGTINISSINIPDIYSSLDYFITFKNHTYFSGKNTQNNTELFKTDGTIQNTKLLKDLEYSSSSSPAKLINVNGNVFFRGTNEDSFGNQLFKSDGTKDGTNLVKRIGSNSNIDDKSEMVVINNKLIFSAHNNSDGYEPWISDGTEEGTFMIKNIRSEGSSLRNYNDIQPFYAANNIAYFFANDGEHGFEPWRSDGTEEGTFMLKDIRTYGNGTGHDQIGGSSWPKDFIEFNGFTYFIAFDTNGSAVWKTDSTKEGTEKVYEHPNIGRILKINNKLFFAGYDNSGIFWESDGTEAGTKNINLLSYINLVNANKIHLNNDLYFVSRLENISNRVGLYKTDGTENGTTLLYEGLNHPTLDNVIIKNLTECNEFIYFELEDYYGRGIPELWRTNGSVTEKIDTDTGNFEIFLTCHKNNLFYNTDDISIIKVITENLSEPISFKLEITNNENFSEYSNMHNLTSSGDYLFFTGRTDNSGEELFSAKINTQVLSTVTNFTDQQAKSEIHIYPNPASNYIKITSTKKIKRYTLYTINGKMIFSTKVSSGFETNIPVNKVVKGIYFLEIILDSKKITKKIIINK
jgi:ELWxxDGT repeat protein